MTDLQYGKAAKKASSSTHFGSIEEPQVKVATYTYIHTIVWPHLGKLLGIQGPVKLVAKRS